jgi:methenyltetrahydromethanopterin cyclohydrolase
MNSKLKKAIYDIYNIKDDLETILYAVGDSPIRPTEDQLMNMLIGTLDKLEFKYQKLSQEYDSISDEI